MVVHAQVRLAAGACHLYQDLATVGRKRDRVVKEVVEDLSQPVAVPDDDNRPLWDIELDGCRRRQQPGAPDRVSSESDEIDVLALEDEAIILSLDPLSEVADHPLHALRLLQDGD